MLWRAWCFIVGLPLGALALLAAWPGPLDPPLVAIELASVAGGVLLLAVASLVARVRDDDHDRGRHLAASASVGLAALPALALALLDAGPPLWVVAAATVLALAGALARGAWRRGPAPGALSSLGVALAALGAGSVLAVGWSAIAGSFAPSPPAPTPQQANAVYDLDAKVATRALPRCSASPSRVETLLDRGAHPRIGGPDGAQLWFDARADGGRRQVHRMDLATREVRCWTCGEDGDNVNPSPSDGAGVVFETNRWATWRDPSDTEIQITTGVGDDDGGGSRRLTVSPGRDSQPLLGPGGGLLAWSRGAGGSVDVVGAPLRSGHGGLLLGEPRVIFAGGSRWAAPLAWAADARSLVVVRGNPLRPLDAVSIDLATGMRSPVGEDVPGAATASFTADGGWLALPTTTRGRVAGLLPSRLGFLVAPMDALLVRDAPRFRGSGVRTGEPWGIGGEVALGDVAAWGEPTGIALAPDGRSFVLGQRRAGADAPEERLLRIELDCASPGGV